MPSQSKNTLYILGGVVIVGVIAYYFYQKGKAKPTIENLPPDLSGTTTTTGTTPTSNSQLQELAGQIYEDAIGANVFSNHDESIYERALALSNTDFVQLYNIFNSLYQPELKETLHAIIDDQWAIPYTPWETIKNAMLNRFNSLHLPK